MIKNIYTELSNITEKEFFQRELKVKVITSSNYKMLENVSNPVIASDNPQYWSEFLQKRNKDSVVFMLLGNETYEPSIFNNLNGYPSLRHVFIYNKPTRINPFTLVKTMLGHMIDRGFQKLPYPDSIYRDFRNSMYLSKKFSKIEIEYPNSYLPQGYSNNFAFKLALEYRLESNYSLLSEEFLNLHKGAEYRSNFLSFSGQTTNRRRELMVKASEKYMNEAPDYTEGFRGAGHNGDSTYVNQLRSSKFILIPPGSFNNSNHRYTEALICGAIPVILAKNSLDPSENTNWTNSIPGITPFSAKLLLSYLSKFSDKEIDSLILKLRELDFSKISNFRNQFMQLT
jgi:hypothetical protein